MKRTKKLEKENAELKTEKIPQLERRIASIRGAHSVDCRKLNARTEQVERLKKENAELKGKYAHSAREAGTYNQLFEKMKSALERWYNQHSDKSYTETFYEKLIADTEELLWSNCER